MLASTVEAATSNTSPPGGPSEVQALAPTGLSPRYFVPTALPGLMPLARFPCSGSRCAGPRLDATSFFEDSANEGVVTACDEPIRAADALDVARRPAGG